MLSPNMLIAESALGLPPGQNVKYLLMISIPGLEFSRNSKDARNKPRKWFHAQEIGHYPLRKMQQAVLVKKILPHCFFIPGHIFRRTSHAPCRNRPAIWHTSSPLAR